MLNGHVADCPMKSRMDIVEDYIIAQKTKAADGKNWMDRLWPLIWSALGVVVYLPSRIAMHAAEMLKLWKP